MDMQFQGTGWKFPVVTSPLGNIAFSKGEEDIKEAIWIILSTARGERMMRPNFGCGIHDLVFAPIDPGTLAEVEANVLEALTVFEPRIELVKVEASDEEAEQGRLLISIDYRIRATNNEFNLVFPFYLREGNE